MNCPKCGKELKETSKFCISYGAMVAAAENTAATKAVQPTANPSKPAEAVQRAAVSDSIPASSQSANNAAYVPLGSYKELLDAQKYSMIKFKKTLAVIMIIITGIAIISGIIAVIPVFNSYTDAVDRADSISYISSVGGKTLEEAYYQDYGKYLSDEISITYTQTCILSGFYQTILWLSLLYWIYLLKKTSSQKKLYEAVGILE